MSLLIIILILFAVNSGGGLAGLAGAGGGMPDIANLLSNPALMNMAQTLMTDPNMQNM